MKLKSLIILVLIAGAFAFFELRKSGGEWESESAGNVLPEDFPTEKIAQIEVHNAAGRILMQKGEDGIWGVAERGGYPAEMHQLWQFVVSLTQLRMAEPVENDAAALGLEDGSAVNVVLRSDDGFELAALKFGKKTTIDRAVVDGCDGEIPVGRFVDNGKLVAQVPYTFALLDDPPQEWLDKEFFRVQKLRRMSCRRGDMELWAASRSDEKSMLAVEGDVPAGKVLDVASLNTLQNMFWKSRFDDVQAAGEWVPEREYVLEEFSALKVILKIGPSAGASRIISVTAECGNDAAEEVKQQVSEFNRRFGKWNYLLNERVISALPIDRGQFWKEAQPQNADSAGL